MSSWSGDTEGIAVLVACLVAYAGACVGSFIHVLALRWSEALLHPEQSQGEAMRKALWGRSRCDHCGQVLKPWQLLPLLGVLLLKGRCGFCGGRIALRDSLAEWLLGAAWLALWWRHGADPVSALWLAWASTLLLLALIDLDTYLLPDVLTLGLMAMGVLASVLGLVALRPLASFAGAALGYAMLAGVAWAYRKWRGREGLGLGDAKLLAALGAWLGPWSLPLVLWLAALLGLVWGLLWRWRGHAREDGAFPFGPALAMAGFIVALWPRAWEWLALGVMGS